MYTPLALIASCFFSLIQLSFTAPIVESRAATQFYLQTSVINGTKDTGSKKGGLYVYAFHTGAGLNDAVLSSNKTIASKGSLNGTDLTFALAGSTLTWNATLSSDTNNAGMCLTSPALICGGLDILVYADKSSFRMGACSDRRGRGGYPSLCGKRHQPRRSCRIRLWWMAR